MNLITDFFKEFIDFFLKKEDLTAKVVCLGLACGLWFYVMSIENPIIERSVDVHLQQVNLQENMVVSKLPDKITVRIRGKRSYVTNDVESKIHASVDLANVESGEQKLAVHVIFNGGEILDISPSKVTAVVDSLATKTVPVYTRVVGTPQDDMTLGNSRITPSSVTITGASQLIRNIRKVVAPVDVSNLDKNFRIDCELVAVADSGYDVPDVKITPARVTVSASMVKQMLTVELPVEIALTGSLPAGVKVTKTEVLPEKVRLTAPPSIIKGMTAIKTKPFDLGTVHGSIAPALELDLPDKVVPESRVVQVRISVDNASTANKGKAGQ